MTAAKAIAGLTLVIIMAAGNSCTGAKPKPRYDADPVGGKEQCFTIDREYKDSEKEVSLGQFCKSN